MKKILFTALALSIFTIACSSHPAETSKQTYVCPMHPQVQQDHPGECPICHMTLVPLENKSSTPQEEHSSGAHIPQHQQAIMQLKLATAELKQAEQSLRVSGKVAFDVDLLTAQQEFLALHQSNPDLAAAAKQRLSILGMNEAAIKKLLQRGKADMSLVASNAPRWITASLFSEEAKLVAVGQLAKVFANDGHQVLGKIQTVEPLVGSINRLVQVRIELEQADSKLFPQELVRVEISIPLGEQLIIPRSSVLDSGTRKMVMVQESSEHFTPREVEVSHQLGDNVSIANGLVAGEKVVQDAAFLVDAESQLKSALSGSSAHQHGGTP